MTLARLVYLICEGRDGGQWCLAMTGHLDASDAVEARKKARAMGWIRKAGKDLCPRHQTYVEVNPNA